MPSFGKVAVVGIVGNEDGAHHVTAELLQALNDTGWTDPRPGGLLLGRRSDAQDRLQGPAEVPDNVQGLARMLAANAATLQIC